MAEVAAEAAVSVPFSQNQYNAQPSQQNQEGQAQFTPGVGVQPTHSFRGGPMRTPSTSHNYRMRSPFYHPRPTLEQMAKIHENQKRNQGVGRKTLDYSSSILNMLENRTSRRTFKSRNFLQPSPAYSSFLQTLTMNLDNPAQAITTKFCRQAVNKFRCPIFCVSWLPDGRRLVTAASSGEFTLWNGLQHNFETILQAHDGPIRTLRWTNDGNWMVSGDHSGYVKYWQSNMNNIKMYQAHKDCVRDISFSPSDNKFASCSDDGTVRIWDFQRCFEEKILRGHGADVKCLDWHPTKGMVASGSKDANQPMKLWDPRNGQSLATLHGHKNTVMKILWNRNGNWLLTASRDYLLKLWDVRMLKDVQTFRGHKKEVYSTAWHPIYETLFSSGGLDGSVFFWTTDQEKEIGSIEGAHDNIIWTMAWHPLGHMLATGSNDHNTKFWTRNRPGNMMRDRYNKEFSSQHKVTPMEASVSGETDEGYFIPGMGLEEGQNWSSQPVDVSEEKMPGLTKEDLRNEQHLKSVHSHLFKRKHLRQPRVNQEFDAMWSQYKQPHLNRDKRMSNRPPMEDSDLRDKSGNHDNDMFLQDGSNTGGPERTGPNQVSGDQDMRWSDTDYRAAEQWVEQQSSDNHWTEKDMDLRGDQDMRRMMMMEERGRQGPPRRRGRPPLIMDERTMEPDHFSSRGRGGFASRRGGMGGFRGDRGGRGPSRGGRNDNGPERGDRLTERGDLGDERGMDIGIGRAEIETGRGGMGPGRGGMGPGRGGIGSGMHEQGPGIGEMGPGIREMGTDRVGVGPGMGDMGPGRGGMGAGRGGIGPGMGEMGPGRGGMGAGRGGIGPGMVETGPGRGGMGAGMGEMGPGRGGMGAGRGGIGSGMGEMGPGRGGMGAGMGGIGPVMGEMGPGRGGMGAGRGGIAPGMVETGPGRGGMGAGMGEMGPGRGGMGSGRGGIGPGMGEIGPGRGGMGAGNGGMGFGRGETCDMGPGNRGMRSGRGGMGPGVGEMGLGRGMVAPGRGGIGCDNRGEMVPLMGNMGGGRGGHDFGRGDIGVGRGDMGGGRGDMGSGRVDGFGRGEIGPGMRGIGPGRGGMAPGRPWGRGPGRW